jgi:hypothetical protein
MYFVSFRGNSKVTFISIRSVFKKERWYIESDFSNEEKRRIEKRFDDEIVNSRT